MTEQWKDIGGFDGAYQVSNLGQIRRSPGEAGRNTSAKPGRILRARPDCNGYPRIVVYNRIQRKFRCIGLHTAVLEAFVGQRPPGTEASHLNGVRSDARLENLCWETRSENHRRKLAHGTLMWGEKHPLAKLTVAKVKEIRQRAVTETHKAIAADFGVNRRTISAAVSGDSWPHVNSEGTI